MGWAAANDRANGSNGPDRPVSVSPPAVVTGAPAAINGLPRSEVGWAVGWAVGCDDIVGWAVGWIVGWNVGWLVGWKVG